MRHFWNITAIVLGALQFSLSHAQTPGVFSHAQINVPFEVRTTGTWVEIIDTQEEWHAFYSANAKITLGSSAENFPTPEFDFASYTIVAGGLGAGASGRSLLIEQVRAAGSTTFVGALVLRTSGSCASAAVVTYPTVVILIPKPQGNLQINSREATFACNWVGV